MMHRSVIVVVVQVLAVYTAGIAFAQEPVPPGSVTAPETHSQHARTLPDWPVFRGDPLASGVARSELPEQLTERWNQKLPGTGIEASPIVVDVGNGQRLALIADMDGHLHALDLATGEPRWTFDGELGFNASPAWHKGRVYIGDLEGIFHCVGPDGKEIWQFRAGAQIDSGAGFFGDSVLFTSQDAYLYCLDATTGEKRWEVETGDQLRCSPTVVEGQCFLAGCDGLLHVVDLNKGEVVATVEINSPTGATPAAAGDMVFFGTEKSGLLAINWRERKLVWEFDDEGRATAIRSNPAIRDGRLVFGADSRRVYCLSAADGAVQWTADIKSGMETSPVIVGERVFVAGADGRLYAFAFDNGQLLWEHEAGGGFSASPAVAWENLVIGTRRGTVLCFGQPAPAPAGSVRSNMPSAGGR